MIVLERPACPVCDATLLGRRYYQRNLDGKLVGCESGEKVDWDNTIVVIFCPRCGCMAGDVV